MFNLIFVLENENLFYLDRCNRLLKDKNVQIKASSLLTVNYNLIFHIIGAIVTYTVIANQIT